MIHVPGELTCKEMVELMNDYLEGRLAPAELSDFERHLAYCDGCEDYLRQLRQLKAAATRSAFAMIVNPGFTAPDEGKKLASTT